MMKVIENKSGLSRNEALNNLSSSEDLKSLSNFSLEDISLGGIVEGIVQDSIGIPISGAIVQLMSLTFQPSMHATTDATGSYTIKNVPIGQIFRIYAKFKNKKLQKEENLIAISLGETIQRNFILEDEITAKLAIIAGDVFDLTTKKGLGNVSIKLYYLEEENEKLLMSTFTNGYGQFTFRDLSLSNYKLQIDCLGYVSKVAKISITNEGQISSLKVMLEEDKSDGTISGLIKDDNGIAIFNADVILYRVENDRNLTPLSFTKTNAEGLYLFKGVIKGTYKIKSNQFEKITVFSPNSPNFYYFEITDLIDSFTKRILPEDTILLDEATIKKDIDNISYISNIVQGKGQVKFTVLISKTQNYYLKICYKSYEDKSCNVKINDINIDYQNFNFPPTGNYTGVISRKVLLNEGYNTFEFYNA